MKNACIYLICLLFICNSLVAQNPYAYYPLSGTANDTTSNHLNGTITGTPTPTTNQYNQPNSALLFNGTSDYIVLPTNFDFPYRTIIAWFRASVIGSSNTENVAYMSDNSNLHNGATNITTNDSSNVYLISMLSDQFNWTHPADTGIWYQCAVVRSPLKVKFFINGVLLDSALNPSGAHSSNQSTFNAVIGADRDFNGLFNGKIDDVAIYDTVLSDQAIMGAYTSISEIHQIDDALKVYSQNADVIVQLPESLYNNIQSIVLYNISGQALSSKIGYQYNGKLNDNHLSTGTYIVTVYIKNQTRGISRKVIVSN